MFFAVYTLFDAELVKSVADDSLAYSYAMDAFIGVRYTILLIPLYNFFYTFVLYMGGTKFALAASVIDLTLNSVLAENAANAVRIMALSTIPIIMARVTTIFDQYTEKIGRATILLLMAYGLVPAALAYLLGGISIECMTFAIAVGPAVLIAAVWIFGRPNKTNKVSLHRMTVIIGDEF